MQKIVLVALATLVIGLMGTSRITAAPTSGSVIGHAAAMTSPITKVPCASAALVATAAAYVGAYAGRCPITRGVLCRHSIKPLNPTAAGREMMV